MNRIDETRLADVIFACAVTANTPRSIREIQDSVGRFRLEGTVAHEWEGLVSAALIRLQSDGRLDARRASGPKGESSRHALGLTVGTRWVFARDRVLPAMALGIGPVNPAHFSTVKDGMAAAIVARSLGLWKDGAPPSPAALSDALVWRDLGLHGLPKRIPDEVRALFLRKRLRSASGDGDASRWLRQLAAQILGAPSTTAESLRNALVARWIVGLPLESQAPSPAKPTEPEPRPRPFVEAVRRAAHLSREGRFGDRQVFIASVWRNLRSDAAFGDISLDEFKGRLVEAHRAGQLALVRADLVGALDPLLVAESEIRHHDARFHFVLEEAV